MHIVFLKKKNWSKDSAVQPILPLLKLLNKKEYGSTNIVFWQNFDQKIVEFNPYSLLRKFWTKDNMVQPVLSS